MTKISLPPSIISSIIDNTSQLAIPGTLNLTPSTVAYILEHGYNQGFKSVFILNASLTAVATIASFLMIKHKELTRGDEEELRRKAVREIENKLELQGTSSLEKVTDRDDVEKGVIPEGGMDTKDKGPNPSV